MSHLRFILACLIMLAIPLQGSAAASMVTCAGDHSPHLVASVQDERSADGHDHSAHSHAAGAASQASSDHAAGQKSVPDASQECGVCASCCHTVALTYTRIWPEATRSEQEVLPEPFVPVHAAPSALPDKPPRA